MFHLIQFETVARVTLITQNIPKKYGFVWKYCTPKNPIVNYNVHSFSLLILNYGMQYPIFRQTHMHYFFYANFHQVCSLSAPHGPHQISASEAKTFQVDRGCQAQLLTATVMW